MKKIIVVSEEDHGDMLYAESYETAIKALSEEGWLYGSTELSTPFGVTTLGDWFGEDWEVKLLKNPKVLNDFSTFCLSERDMYLDEDVK